MEKQTILCTALPNGRAADGALLLSVHIAPRLRSDDASVAKLALSQFPDWLAWTATVGAAKWKVSFNGQPPIVATVTSDPPRADLWGALFKTDTDVVPFRFEDHIDTVIESIDSRALLDTISGVYVRAAADPQYGQGRDLPPIEILAADPDLSDIARPSTPEQPPQPGPPPPPIDLGGKPPVPPQPEPPPAPSPPPADHRWCRCICWLLRWLLHPFPKLMAWVDWLCVAGQADDHPLQETGPTSWPIPTPGMPPGSPTVIAPGPLAPPPITPPPPAPSSPKKQVFDAAVAFVTPPPIAATPLPTAAELEEMYDFHSMIATLGDYRTLMRMLGLVIDLRIDVAAGMPAPSGTVTVAPDLTFAMATTVASPRTHYTLDGTSFLAASRVSDPSNPGISNGFLPLNDTDQFSVIQVDVVGGAIKLQNTATNMMVVSNKTKRAPTMPDNSGLPALRTAGISVVRHNHVAELHTAFQCSAALQRMLAALDGSAEPAPVTEPAPAARDDLFAEDLVRGYRIDVFDDKSNTWHSLCRRKGTYDFLAAPAAPGETISLDLEDEGFVQFAATNGSDPATTLRTTDSLFTWNGWSLCAPRPGLSIMPDDQPDGTTTLATPDNQALTKFKFEANFTAKTGSLPRLRFGYQYSLRARVCDLAGNSVFGPDDAAFAHNVTEQTPPFPCVRYEPVSPPAMMLRAAPVEGESLERMVVRSPAVNGETQATERHIIPPKVSQLTAEQHGKFDGSPQMDGTQTGYDLAKKESGALTDGATQVAAAPGGAPAKASELTWIFAGNTYQQTYLTDPISRGAVLLRLPGLTGDEIVEPSPPAALVNKIPFTGAWPSLDAFRLRLTAIPAGTAPAKPQWDGAERLLMVQLPEAEKQTIRVSSYFGADDFTLSGITDWTKTQAPAQFGQVQTDAVAGRSWLHLPWRDVTLVHAVQKPLQPTGITALAAGKNVGDTFATLTGTLAPHAASTSKVDILAAWQDPIDDPAQPMPGTRDFNAHVCEVLIPEGTGSLPLTEGAANTPPLHHFHDTKYHKVTYSSVATTRFREYFPRTITDDPANITLANAAGFTVSVDNSARPDAPKVLYVVPTYSWSAPPPAGATTVRERKGNGLRVYLDRPWFSSGDDELLGVVYLKGKTFTSFSKDEKLLITHWGADPIWLSAATSDAATIANFVGFKDKADGPKLAENGLAVSVVGYPVEFDAARRLWFADVVLDIGPSYTPFVRLALARFQPHSVGDAFLSRVVRADFAQLAADRSASYTVKTSGGTTTIDIVVKGPTYTASDATSVAGTGALAEIDVLLQKRNPQLGTEANLGWDTVSTQSLTQDPTHPGVWKGTVTAAGPMTPNTFRLLLQEYEYYRTDFAPAERGFFAGARRVVYADTIGLG